MFATSKVQHCKTNFRRLLRIEPAEVSDHIVCGSCDQDLAIDFEECFNTFPEICNDARARAGSFENASGWRESDMRHGITIHIEYHPR